MDKRLDTTDVELLFDGHNTWALRVPNATYHGGYLHMTSEQFRELSGRFHLIGFFEEIRRHAKGPSVQASGRGQGARNRKGRFTKKGKVTK